MITFTGIHYIKLMICLDKVTRLFNLLEKVFIYLLLFFTYVIFINTIYAINVYEVHLKLIMICHLQTR